MAQALGPQLELGSLEPRKSVSDQKMAPRGVASVDPLAAAVGRQFTFVVENMRCGGCMRKVETALLGVAGTMSARVNLSTGRVGIVVDRSIKANSEPYIEALKSAGFTARELPSDEAVSNSLDEDLERRLAVAGFATMNIMLLSVAVWSGAGGDMEKSLQTALHWLSAVIAIPAVAYAGVPFFASALAAIRARRINMDVPISLGVLLATGMSLYQTTQVSEQVYFDAAVSLLFFLLIGRVLDQKMRRQAKSAAENFLGLLSPATTIVHSDGATERIATSAVRPGMALIIAAGERVPVDAKVTRGRAEIDEALLTGETVPRQVLEGGSLYAGTINLGGPVEAVATAVEDNTLLAEIARLMQTAEQARGRYVRLADRAARLYAPAVHILGLATFIGWMWVGYTWEPALTAAIAVLIVTCPCALALAVPAVQVAAIGRLFKRGIVVKAPDGLERLSEVDTIVLDKTGTLTLGEPELVPGDDVSDDVLAKAAALAANSRHPYARAVVKAAYARGLTVVPVAGVEEIAGSGLRASLDGSEVKLGSPAFCDLAALANETGTGGAGEEASLWLRHGNARPTAFRFIDPLRSDASTVVARLIQLGYAVELLSGDRTAIVAATAKASGITQWRAEVRPDEKTHRLDELKAEGRKVLMVGDGLNDAPALASAHASIAPATAADISQTASDVIFQGSKLSPLIETLAVAKASQRAALGNFAISIGYNVIFVPLAVMGIVTPIIAAIAMSLSSITVTANAIWLGHKRLKDAT